MLKVGNRAPSFTLENTDHQKTSLKDFLGQKVVLYFYPKDLTSGCTKQAVAFSEMIAQVEELNAVILGVSKDSIERHQKFIEKFDLKITLLSDVDGKICEKYDVWKEKSMYGKKYMGIERTTFVINEEGKISHIFPKVKVTNHAQAVLLALKEK